MTYIARHVIRYSFTVSFPTARLKHLLDFEPLCRVIFGTRDSYSAVRFPTPSAAGNKNMKPEKEINKREVNLLKLIPEREIEYRTGEDGIVTLLKLKFKNRFLVKYLLPRFKNPFFKYKLDKIGSFVWLMCDGERRVEEIADLMKEEFGEEVEPCLDRLSLFLNYLEKSGYISFTNVEKEQEEARDMPGR